MTRHGTNRQRHSSHQKNQHHQNTPRKRGHEITFYDEHGNMLVDLLDDQARKAAEIVSKSSSLKNKSTQLRRFYDELVMWEEKTRTAPEQFDTFLPFVRMLKAKAAYAMGRNLVDGAFLDMLNQIIDQINKPKDMTTAKLFFEAFLGYYKLAKRD